MERFNNWMSYSFDNNPIGQAKPSKNSVFNLHFKNTEVKSLNYYDALFYNARLIADNYPQPFDVLFSGGIDSEVIVRLHKKLGIHQNVHIFKLENNLNIRDVISAEKICKELDIKLNVIDWNLQHWIENEAYEVYQKTFSPLIGRMIRFAWFDFFDNTIIMGEGEPYWRRENWDNPPDYSIKSNWHLHWNEDYFMSSLYADITGQTVIGEWYNYTPEIVKSFHKLPLVQDLINDNIPGKLSSWSSRTEIHRHIFPTIEKKIKLAGYEGTDRDPLTIPDFMEKFQDEVIGSTSNFGYKFTEEELDKLLL